MKPTLNFINTLRSSQIVIAYSRNMNIRKRVFEFEDALKDSFKTPFRTIAVPEELDPNIPRFESQSIHQFSQLQVSQNRLNIATNFDGKLNQEEFKEYLVNKRESISNLVSKENIEFIAYVLDLAFVLKPNEINGILKKNSGALAISEVTKDFHIGYSQIYKEAFYINITCSKFIEKQMILDPNNNDLRETDNVRHGISVKVDLNTRYYFEKNAIFKENLYKSIEETIFNIVENTSLEDYLKGEI